MEKPIDCVYIHIPFCKEICTYCDFCKFYYEKKWVKNYLKALEKEIKERYKGEEISKLYIGGGTPSALETLELEYLFKIIKNFKLAKEYEFTFECNLNDINDILLGFLVSNGVNRISIGIQSFDEHKLKFLGRQADFEDARKKVNLCRAKGIDNINVDLIYALPGETIKILKNDLRLFKKLDVTHVSTYSLMIEPHTVLAYKKAKPISEDLDAAMYEEICREFRKVGLTHYEISNFAFDGYESKHNLTYWNNEEYYGFGLGSGGYVDGIRYTNTRSLSDYLKGNYVLEEEELSLEDMMDYEIMLGLRKTKGINLKEFYEKYHVNLQHRYDVDKLIAEKDLTFKKGNIFISPDKLYVMNEILVKLI